MQIHKQEINQYNHFKNIKPKQKKKEKKISNKPGRIFKEKKKC